MLMLFCITYSKSVPLMFLNIMTSEREVFNAITLQPIKVPLCFITMMSLSGMSNRFVALSPIFSSDSSKFPRSSEIKLVFTNQYTFLKIATIRSSILLPPSEASLLLCHYFLFANYTLDVY